MARAIVSSPRKNSINVRVDMSEVYNLIGEVEKQAIEALRPAAYAGAKVLYEEVKSNAAKIPGTGNLAASIYHAFSEDQSTPTSPLYHISWRTGSGEEKDENGKVLNTLPIAQNAHWIEFGYWRRYKSYLDKKGQWYTAVRPEKRKTPKPRGRAPQAVMDAYYVPLEGGPKWVPARPFVRPAVSAYPRAAEAAIDRFLELMQQGGLVK